MGRYQNILVEDGKSGLFESRVSVRECHRLLANNVGLAMLPSRPQFVSSARQEPLCPVSCIISMLGVLLPSFSPAQHRQILAIALPENVCLFLVKNLERERRGVGRGGHNAGRTLSVLQFPEVQQNRTA